MNMSTETNEITRDYEITRDTQQIAILTLLLALLLALPLALLLLSLLLCSFAGGCWC